MHGRILRPANTAPGSSHSPRLQPGPEHQGIQEEKTRKTEPGASPSGWLGGWVGWLEVWTPPCTGTGAPPAVCRPGQEHRMRVAAVCTQTRPSSSSGWVASARRMLRMLWGWVRGQGPSSCIQIPSPLRGDWSLPLNTCTLPGASTGVQRMGPALLGGGHTPAQL